MRLGELIRPERRPTVLGRMRRNAELGLMLLAAVVIVGAYVLASLAEESGLPADIGPILLVVLGLLGGAHVATRRLAPDADGMLLPIAALLNGIGYVFIARLDEDLAALQALWTAIGVASFVATLVVVRRTRVLERYRYTFMVAGIGLLVVPLLPFIGREINGARIWASIGPVNFQPGEFAEDRARGVLRRIPGGEARAALHDDQADRAGHAPRSEAPGSGARRVGCLSADHDPREGSRFLTPLLRPVRPHVVGGDRARHLPGRGLRTLRPGCVVHLDPVRRTSNSAWPSGSTRGATSTTKGSSWPSRCSRSRGEESPVPVWVSAARSGSPLARPTSSSR
ncbi:MAG: FtsW/RodA/SpoVE family cell cycle protein [Acidimicrobiia bacterium]|nr:FtsW/RodA/SpoVE family cell cycle protein [Acidimicrobiia bacterium]